MSGTPKFADLIAELELAQANHEDMVRAESVASSNECAARNRLNAAQKAIDAAMANLKKAAPAASDWAQERRASTRAATA